jgi:hypothetical protein
MRGPSRRQINRLSKVICEDVDLFEAQADPLESVKGEVKRAIQKLILAFDRSRVPRAQALQVLTLLIQEVIKAGDLSQGQALASYKQAINPRQAKAQRQAGAQQQAKAQRQAGAQQAGVQQQAGAQRI